MTAPPLTGDVIDLVRRLALLLDAAQPLLDAAARRERQAEAGKTLRQITAQQRARTAFTTVSEANTFLLRFGRGLPADDAGC